MDYRIDGSFILVVGKDGEGLEDVARALKEAGDTPNIMAAVSATGMLRRIKLGYWDGEKYLKHSFEQPMELLGISGFISKNADPFYHFHLTLADREGRVWRGHLLEAEVCNTLELFLLGGSLRVKRVPVGRLKLISLE